MLTNFGPYLTPTVAVVVALISYRQWRTANDKLRLDLYNRRLELYMTVLDLEDVLAGWTGTEKEEEAYVRFRRASREASFLFPPDSQVAPAFQQLNGAAVNITKIEAWKKVAQDEEKYRSTDWQLFRLDGFNLSVNYVFILQARITPFLMFSSASDPFSWLNGLRVRVTYRRSLAHNLRHATEGIAKIREAAATRGGFPPY